MLIMPLVLRGALPWIMETIPMAGKRLCDIAAIKHQDGHRHSSDNAAQQRYKQTYSAGESDFELSGRLGSVYAPFCREQGCRFVHSIACDSLSSHHIDWNRICKASLHRRLGSARFRALSYLGSYRRLAAPKFQSAMPHPSTRSASDCMPLIRPTIGIHCIYLHDCHPTRVTENSQFSYANRYARFLSSTVQTRVLDPAILPTLLRTLRASLFPNNGLGPPRQPPSEEETKEIKRRCAATLLSLLPTKLASAFFATQHRMDHLRQIEELLDCLDDVYLNKHLIFAIIELIILRLLPEMGERGVQALMEERLG